MISTDNSFAQLKNSLAHIEHTLGLAFQNKELLISSFIHSSYVNEHKNLGYSHNERLEFLGDAVLNLIVGEYLFKKFPHAPEGDLSALRAAIVSSASCLLFVEKLQLDAFVLTGRGEKIHGKKGHVSILADHFEALLGAIYLEFGLEITRNFFLHRFADELEVLIKSPQKNWKAELQHLVQKEMKVVPAYLIIDQEGPEHDKQFTVGVYIEDKLIGTGCGSSKKEAAQEAAREALALLQPGIAS